MACERMRITTNIGCDWIAESVGRSANADTYFPFGNYDISDTAPLPYIESWVNKTERHNGE
jgi:hypothetical protein